MAIQTSLKSERDQFNRFALEALEKATQNDINDHLCEYYLSLQYALINNITEALNHIRLALSLRAEHAPSLHLFGLLLTASRRPREALTVVEDALEEFPDNLNLLHVRAYLQLHMQDADIALATVQKMLSIWREQYESQVNSEDEKHSDTKSVVLHVPSSQLSDKDSSKMSIIILLPSIPSLSFDLSLYNISKITTNIYFIIFFLNIMNRRKVNNVFVPLLYLNFSSIFEILLEINQCCGNFS